VNSQKAGFSGSFPEGWIMLPEELPGDIVRVVFRPPGGGLQRSHQGIIVTLGHEAGPLAKGLDAYLSAFSGLAGFKRTENVEGEQNGMPAASATFRSEIEDESGLHIAANVVTALRSPGGKVAFIHVILDAENFSQGFDTQVTPVIEDFRFIE
jgi:hypothetical protein